MRSTTIDALKSLAEGFEKRGGALDHCVDGTIFVAVGGIIRALILIGEDLTEETSHTSAIGFEA